ncbi:MAG TPA: type II toxin-antitoxin system PemK/MazF family toxin, partial [Tepidisphaeraceae bacterium]|nr:type II toxin-antitoxin system PemK/MazF family toxin [Tepidisphaeraceae bacterium]
IRHGRIIFCWIKDHNGHAKLRPAVIVSQDIRPAGLLVVMAITTTFSDPPPEFCIALPWHPREHPVTRLRKRSAAVVNWLATISSDDIIGFGGDVPKGIMQIIREKLDQI